MEIWILQGCSHHTPWLQPLTYGIIWVKKPIYEFDKTGRKFLWRWIIIRDPLIFPLMSIFITGRSPFFLLHYQGKLTFLDAIKSFLSLFSAMFITWPCFCCISRKIDFFGRDQICFELILSHVYCVHYNIASFYDIVSIDVNSVDLISNPSRPNCLWVSVHVYNRA